MELDVQALVTAMVIVFAVTRVLGVLLHRVFNHKISALVAALAGAMIIFACKFIGGVLPFVGPEEEPVYYYGSVVFCFIFDMWLALRK